MASYTSAPGCRLVKPGEYRSLQELYRGKRRGSGDELEARYNHLEAECQALRDTLKELEESRNRYAVLYDYAPVGYATLDSKGCIKDINLAGSSMLGLEPSTLIDMPLVAYIVKGDIKLFLEHLRRCRSSERVTTELKFLSRNGNQVEVLLLSVPCGCPGGAVNYITIFTDITERKLYEREMARLDSLSLVGEMAAGIGHEVRNPMTTVKGFLQILRGRDKYAGEREIFNLMVDELDRANSIITEFLSLAKDKHVALKEENLNKLLQTILPLIQADCRVTGKHISLETRMVPDLLLDEKEIRQMVLNLVRNGIEAMDPGGMLKISTYAVDDGVVLSVKDQGAGMEPEVLKKLGTPFFTTKDKGTGLGLPVCYSIAARHNARIDVQTGTGGTTFSVIFKRPA